ncbi:MAG: FHA domain-containing protein [Planctomycetes bacterium]|nr:FHA domain-containing protein [Planctomycetota bacterium]
MNTADSSRPHQFAHLADTSPRVRATSGVGTIAQKTWNLHRPVTIIGSARQSHICLCCTSVSNAHCALVNTGTEVLVKDLHTQTGTLRNTDVLRLAQLEDGDVLRIGPTPIQVALREPFNTPQHRRGVDPRQRNPLALGTKVRLVGPSGQTWDVVAAVSVLGTDRNVEVRLDDVQVSSNHALICGINDNVVLVDLGTRVGTSINDHPIPARQAVILSDGDCITIGSTSLTMGFRPTGQTAVPDISGNSTPAEAPCLPPGSIPRTGGDLDARLVSLRTSIQSLSQRLVDASTAETDSQSPLKPSRSEASDPTPEPSRHDYETIGR